MCLINLKVLFMKVLLIIFRNLTSIASFFRKISDKTMFRTFLDGQPPVGSDIGRTSDRNFPKVAPLVPTHREQKECSSRYTCAVGSSANSKEKKELRCATRMHATKRRYYPGFRRTLAGRYRETIIIGLRCIVSGSHR